MPTMSLRKVVSRTAQNTSSKQIKETSLTDEQIKDVVARKKRIREEQRIQAEPGDNAQYLSHSMAMWNWSKPDMQSATDVENRVTDYFQLCVRNDMKPSIEGLAIAFGTDRKSLWRYANGVIKSVPQDVCHTLKKAYTVINALMADYLQNGKINPVAAIFLMKNNMDYTDTTEVVVTPNSPIGAEMSESDLAKRITDGSVIEVEPTE